MTEKMHKKDSISIVYITVLTIVALVYGFMTIPSPVMQHKLTLDHRRVSDLGQIKNSIESYYSAHYQLPDSLKDLPITSGAYQSFHITDPETNTPYEYTILNQTPPFIQLCATFTTDSHKDDPTEYDPNNYGWQSFSGNYQHPPGHYCFKLNISYYGPTPIVSQMPNSVTPIQRPPLRPNKSTGAL